MTPERYKPNNVTRPSFGSYKDSPVQNESLITNFQISFTHFSLLLYSLLEF